MGDLQGDDLHGGMNTRNSYSRIGDSLDDDEEISEHKNDCSLTQELFDSELSYTISYYDSPLQPGIAPRWSDQNLLGNDVEKLKRTKAKGIRKELNIKELERRQ